MRVTAPSDVVLVGAGSIIEETRAGTQTVTFAAGPARDFYLAAGDFTKWSARRWARRLSTVMRRRDGLRGQPRHSTWPPRPMADYSERLAPLSLHGTRHRDHAHERAGHRISCLSSSARCACTTSTRTRREGVPFSAILESTTAHEVAHQWFYNLVGNDQLDEPWLDERSAPIPPIAISSTATDGTWG